MQLQLGEKYEVLVERILNGKGIIVRLESGDTEFIHVSRISTKFVSNISEFVNLGESYTATCVKGIARELELSLIEEKDNSSYSTIKPKHKQEERYDEYDPLEDMIAKSNQQYEDRVQGKRSKKNRNGKSRRDFKY